MKVESNNKLFLLQTTLFSLKTVSKRKTRYTESGETDYNIP